VSTQTDSISRYCVVHGHTADASGKFCLNCGSLDMKPPAEPVPAPQKVDAFLCCCSCGPLGAAVNHDKDCPLSAPLAQPVFTGTITKPTNPKDAVGAGKLSMHLVPTAVMRYAALGFTEGALKYGKYNWRRAGVRISIYLDAIYRHMARLQEGEWCDGDMLGLDAEGELQGTLVPHLASIICCAGIILDAWECDKLTDDRPPINAHAGADLDSRTEHVAHLKKLFESFTPHQHVITDAPKQG